MLPFVRYETCYVPDGPRDAGLRLASHTGRPQNSTVDTEAVKVCSMSIVNKSVPRFDQADAHMCSAGRTARMSLFSQQPRADASVGTRMNTCDTLASNTVDAARTPPATRLDQFSNPRSNMHLPRIRHCVRPLRSMHSRSVHHALHACCLQKAQSASVGRPVKRTADQTRSCC